MPEDYWIFDAPDHVDPKILKKLVKIDYLAKLDKSGDQRVRSALAATQIRRDPTELLI